MKFRAMAYALIVIFSALLIFQVLLALGAPLGKAAWGGASAVLPDSLRIGSWVSAVIFGLALIIVLEAAGRIHIIKRSRLVKGILFFLAGLFALSALGNLVSSSPWERYLMFPVALVSSILCLALGLQSMKKKLSQ